MFVSTGGECGVSQSTFSKGESYLVYSRGSSGLPSVAFLGCGTLRASDATGHFEFLGVGRAPEQGSAAPIPPTCPTSTPTIAPNPIDTPVPTLTPTNTPMSPQPPTSTGSCNILAESNAVPLDAAPLALIAGIAWFGIRRRWRR